MHLYILNMISNLVGQGSLADSLAVPMNAQVWIMDCLDNKPTEMLKVIRVVSKHLSGQNNKEAAKILKILIDQWRISQPQESEVSTNVKWKERITEGRLVRCPASIPRFRSLCGDSESCS